MKVYVAKFEGCEECGDGTQVIGVYATEELAKKASEDTSKTYGHYGWVSDYEVQA